MRGMNNKKGFGISLGNAFTTVFVKHQMPWKVQRLLLMIVANNLRALVTRIKFLFKPPALRIVLSSHFFGGVGGTEKLLQAVVDSMPDCEFLIMADDIRLNGFVPKSYNHYVALTPKKNCIYDVYLYFCGGGKPHYLGDKYKFKIRAIDTNAAQIFDIEHLFDYVLIQSEIWSRFSSDASKIVYAFPEVRSTLPKRRTPVPGLPGRFLLTVFNPFAKAQKGQEVLFSIAPHSALPIVWCYSDASGWDFSTLPATPNVIHLRNLTQEQLYWVYEHAAGYVSFAFYESYGWTLAEAFTSGLPIIARETGIMPYIKQQTGVHLYENEEQLKELLRRDDFDKPNYDESFFLDNSYAQVMRRLIQRP